MAAQQEFSDAQAPQKDRAILTFSERVAYQYAIEEIHWRHRIWPRENARPKPSLDVVISREQVEKKVEDYLRKSQALQIQWHRPITAEQLQAEMDRMASHTKRPEVLRALFAALGNDSFVIAECLARPILADRFFSQLAADGGVEAFVSNAQVLGTSTSTTRAYRLPEMSAPLDCADDTWMATATVNAPQSRESHRAVWTGSELIVCVGGLIILPPIV